MDHYNLQSCAFKICRLSSPHGCQTAMCGDHAFAAKNKGRRFINYRNFLFAKNSIFRTKSSVFRRNRSLQVYSADLDNVSRVLGASNPQQLPVPATVQEFSIS